MADKISNDELKKMANLIKIADKCRLDIEWEFVEFIYEHLDCDMCPI